MVIITDNHTLKCTCCGEEAEILRGYGGGSEMFWANVINTTFVKSHKKKNHKRVCDDTKKEAQYE